MSDKTEYRIVFANYINENNANILRARIGGAIQQADFGGLTILFSSEGGSTDQSLALYNFIRQLPVQVRMHAVGHVGSAAFPVFLSADKRSSAIHARFFLHEYDWGFNERQTIHRIEEALQRLRSDIAIAKKIIEARTELPPNLLNAIGGEAAPAIVSPEEAVKYEIVSEVSDLSQTGRIATWVSGTTP